LTEFLLIRHAVNDFVKTGRLAGWTPDVHLNEDGLAQAAALGERLAHTQIDAAYSSPLERCVETANAALVHHPQLTLHLLEGVGEVRYGTWQGAELGKLAARKLWRAVQINPSRARFPEGETMRAAQMRAVDAIEQLAEQHPRQRVAVFSHSDVIKMILAYYLGMHLDLFQRIDVAPASISILRLDFLRPSVVQMNETSYLPKPKAHTPDPRQIEVVDPTQALTLDAIGAKGSRVFYLQVRGEGEAAAPISFLLEKTQALLLANQIDAFFGQAAPPNPAALPALIAPDKIMFRLGQIALEYDSAQARLCLTLEEMLGEGQGTPRCVRVFATPEQVKALGDQARQVATRGRTTHNEGQ
jgi:probable phosphoglycerate mutase